jgi:hypothetical protein
LKTVKRNGPCLLETGVFLGICRFGEKLQLLSAWNSVKIVNKGK